MHLSAAAPVVPDTSLEAGRVKRKQTGTIIANRKFLLVKRDNSSHQLDQHLKMPASFKLCLLEWQESLIIISSSRPCQHGMLHLDWLNKLMAARKRARKTMTFSQTHLQSPTLPFRHTCMHACVYVHVPMVSFWGSPHSHTQFPFHHTCMYLWSHSGVPHTPTLPYPVPIPPYMHVLVVSFWGSTHSHTAIPSSHSTIQACTCGLILGFHLR